MLHDVPCIAARDYVYTILSEESISNLVNRLIDGQVNEGYFRECSITFSDIAQAKGVLIEKLKSIYHTRIKYPDPNEGKEEESPKQDKAKKKRRRRF